MAQEPMSINEFHQRMAAAIEVVQQGGTSAEALTAAFGDRAYRATLSTEQRDQAERTLEQHADEARRAIPRPDRRRWR